MSKDDPELELSSFASAVERFAEGLEALRQAPDNTLYRDGVIQRFEFTYELSHKMLRRQLEMASANPDEVAKMEFQPLIRTAYEQGLVLNSWDAWREYRQCRTNTSHTYNEEKALRVMDRIPAFLEEARFLLEQLRKRTGQA